MREAEKTGSNFPFMQQIPLPKSVSRHSALFGLKVWMSIAAFPSSQEVL